MHGETNLFVYCKRVYFECNLMPVVAGFFKRSLQFVFAGLT